MRPLPLALLVAAVVACAPGRDDAPADTMLPADTAAASAATATAIDSARAGRDTSAPAATSSAGLVLPAPIGATPRRDAPVSRADSAKVPAPRIKPPTKAPGGYIMVPRSAHDSLRMATPATSTRP